MRLEPFRVRFFDGIPRYRFVGTLGHGGIGIVFKAMDLELSETVAIKVLSPDVERDENALLARFKREIQVNRKIKHPNVARMYDFGFSGDYPFITMELIEGTDLWTLVKERGRIPPAEAVPILRQIARGASAIHRQGIVHRDMKSQNVLVDAEGAAVILDFGLARGTYDPMLTVSSTLLGTPHYMSPEQALGKDVDARADLYSIGVIAFEMLTGRLPFDGDSPVAVAMKHVTDPLPDLLADVPGLAPSLRQTVLRVLEKEREKRFPSAQELEIALALAEQAPPPAPERPLEPEAEAFLAELEKAFERIVVPAGGRDTRTPPRSARPTTSGRREKKPLVLVAAADVRELVKLATAVCVTGCRTVEASSGTEALEVVLGKPVDLVLLDVELPSLDGFDVTRILKSQPALAGLPVLLLSPHADRGQLAFALQSGASDLLSKPVAPSVLGPRLWELLRHRGFSPPQGRDTLRGGKRAE